MSSHCICTVLQPIRCLLDWLQCTMYTFCTYSLGIFFNFLFISVHNTESEMKLNWKWNADLLQQRITGRVRYARFHWPIDVYRWLWLFVPLLFLFIVHRVNAFSSMLSLQFYGEKRLNKHISSVVFVTTCISSPAFKPFSSAFNHFPISVKFHAILFDI